MLTALLPAGDLAWKTTTIEKQVERGSQKVEAVFEFTNASPDPVEIVSVRTSCGCTTAERPKKIYQPGEQGEITVIFAPGERKGKQEKSIIVRTAKSQDILTMRVMIPDAVKIDKERLTWLVGDPLEAQLFNVALRDEAVKVKSVKSLSPEFEAVLVEAPEAKSRRIAVKPTTTQRAVHRVIRLEVEDPSPRTIILPVSVEELGL